MLISLRSARLGDAVCFLTAVDLAAAYTGRRHLRFAGDSPAQNGEGEPAC